MDVPVYAQKQMNASRGSTFSDPVNIYIVEFRNQIWKKNSYRRWWEEAPEAEIEHWQREERKEQR